MLSVFSTPRRDDHLADLALVGHVVADQKVLHHLLGDGRAALRVARIGEIADESADDAALVDAVMVEKAPVFGGDERFLHRVRDGGERDPDPPVARLEHIGEIAALAVEDHAHARELPALEPRCVGQIGSGVVIELDHLAEVDHRTGDILVLAELMVGGVEVGEIDAVKGLDIAGDHLWIVQGG